MGIPPTLLNHMREVLLRCGPFESNQTLSSLFIDGRLSPWRNNIPAMLTKADRVNALLEYLLIQYDSQGNHALSLLFHAIAEQKASGDACHIQLQELAGDWEAALRDVDRELDHNDFASLLPQDAISTSLQALGRLMEFSEVRSAVITFRSDFQAVDEQLTLLARHKRLHDLFQRLESSYYVVYHAVKGLQYAPNDEFAWEHIQLCAPELQGQILTLLDYMGSITLVSHESLWMQKIERARSALDLAVDGYDLIQLRSGITLLRQVLGQSISQTNTRLVATARALRLGNLVHALVTVRSKLLSLNLDASIRGQFEDFEQGVDELDELSTALGTSIEIHDCLQVFTFR